MYGSFGNQLEHWLHYGFAFWLALYVAPKFLFPSLQGDGMERMAANYLRMVLFMIVFGYLSVATKLFEVLFIVPVCLMLATRRFYWSKSDREQTKDKLSKGFYDWLDGRLPVWVMAKSWAFRLGSGMTDSIRRRLTWIGLLEIGLLAAVIGIASYIRLHDAIWFAAPALSDAYTTLEWMKQIDRRELFPNDTIYPRGFHIYLTFLYKFAAIDPLYVLKYTGPLNMVLVSLGSYIVVSRMSGSRMSGIVAAAVFGFLSALQNPAAWERQAATNSQEFAFVFILPSLYFMHLYLQRGRKADGVTAFCGVAITGLVHTLAFGLLAAGAASVLAVHALSRSREQWGRILRAILGSAAAVALSLVPIGYGLLIGERFHSSSANYLTAEVFYEPEIKALNVVDWISLASIVLLLLYACFARGAERRESRYAAGWAALFGAGMLAVYVYGGVVTGSIVIDTRVGELWAIVTPLVIGFGWYVLIAPLLYWRIGAWIAAAIGVGTLAAFVWLSPPVPIQPYKMERDNAVEQYLQIRNTFLPKSWHMVSQEYAIVEGAGFHMTLDYFLAQYDPRYPAVTKFGDTEPDLGISHHLFLFQEKELFTVDPRNSIYPIMEPIYKQRAANFAKLSEWIDIHRNAGHPVDIYYEDETLRIYKLEREFTKDDMHKLIWKTERKEP